MTHNEPLANPPPPGPAPEQGPPVPRPKSNDADGVRPKDSVLLDATFGRRNDSGPVGALPTPDDLRRLGSRDPAGSIGRGLATLLLAHVVAGCASALIGVALGWIEGRTEGSDRPLDPTPLIWLLGIGAVQLVYAIPLGLWLRRRGATESAKGVWIGIAVTMLLNAGCWGVGLGLLR